MTKSTAKKVELKDLKIRTVEIPIIGTSPLIIHKFSDKTRREMEEKQQGKSKVAKHSIKVPEEDFENAKHYSPEGWEGFPCGGFKKAMVRGALSIGMKMTEVRASVFVEPECPVSNLVQIKGESQMRTDMVRVSNGSPDVRYRPEYPTWEATLKITYNEGVVSLDQVFQMLHYAGWGVGIGEWRPEKSGINGRFTIKQ